MKDLSDKRALDAQFSMERKDPKADFIPQAKVAWYSIPQLARTGIKVLLSSIFGEFTDRRELLALMAANEVHQHYEDYAKEEELWLDYVADAGDGFDACFTVARQMSRTQNSGREGEETQPGKILIMGGDQVYPTANIEEYENRLKGPYMYAFPKSRNEDRQLFAIPGNHDWYDGLNSFVKIFSPGGSLGDFTTPQSRSYFAIKLPHNVWVFGVDLQLQSYIDQGQLEYFEDVIENSLSATETNHIILCSAEPSWVYQLKKKTGKKLGHNLQYFEKEMMKNSEGKDLKFVLSLSGDLHHYSRYATEDNQHHKITAGGGGAFLHPTHNLPKEISWKDQKLSLKERYPSADKSKFLSWGNWKFAWHNKSFALFIGILYVLASWFFYVSVHIGDVALGQVKGLDVAKILLLSPFAAVMVFLVAFGTFYFADRDPINPKYKTNLVYSLAGLSHASVQVAALLATFLFLGARFHKSLSGPMPELTALFFIAMIFAAGALISSTIFGLYLTLSNRFLGMHDNEAFSALNLERYKNFLRIHLTRDKLTIYPYGIKEVFKHAYTDRRDKYMPEKEPECELIEPPIVIDLQ